MNSTKYLIGAVAACLCLATACSDDDDNIGARSGEGIAISVPAPAETGATYVSLASTFRLADGVRYTSAGYCIAETENPTIYGTAVDATVSNDSIIATISDLRPSTRYYVRAFMNQYDGHVVYSDQLILDTAEGTLSEQLANYRGPKYPDYYADFSGWGQRSRWNLANVHDPTVMRAADGYWYMYQTDASYGNAHAEGGHFHARRSADLVNWEYLGGTMKELPGWVIPKLNEIRAEMGLAPANPDVNAFGYWAPVARKVSDNLYRMYYSIVVPGTIDGDNSWGERAFIGLMETDNPADNDSWTDKGYVLTNVSDRGLNFHVAPDDWANCYYRFNAIDPSYIITPEGEHWLVYGSWHSGIAAVRLDASTGMPATQPGHPWADNAAGTAAWGTLIATRQAGNRWQASEGPEIVYRDGWYYLFLAYDALDVAYNTRVVRSKSVTGPYVDITGRDVTNNGGDALPVVTHPYKFADSPGWVGISHCAIFDDGEGNWYYASQGRLPAGVNGNDASNALMTGHIRSIVWTADGWPLVMPERYGAVPQLPVTEEELIGTWQHIDLAYSYANQKEASEMVLAADHTIASGTWQGASWTFDAGTQILTANGVKLHIRRECDWESNDRHATIVYAGITESKTYWGKKN